MLHFFLPTSLQDPNNHSCLVIGIQKRLHCVAVTESVPEDFITWESPHSSSEAFLKTDNTEDMMCQGLRCMLQYPSRGHTPPSENCKSSHKVTTMAGETQSTLEIYIRCQSRLRNKSNPFG